MTWEIKVFDEFEREFVNKMAEDLVDSIEEAGADPADEDAVNEAAWDAVHDVVDGWLVYNVDQLAALQYYGHISDGMDACWEDIQADVVEKACEKYAERAEEED